LNYVFKFIFTPALDADVRVVAGLGPKQGSPGIPCGFTNGLLKIMFRANI